MYKIVIVGAGAAGLMAGRHLAEANHLVTILEARNRLGGRMNTINNGFSRAVDEGAEFVHGELPLTLSLLNDAHARYYSMQGRIWRHSGDVLSTDDSFIEDDKILNRKLRELKTDITVKEFLETHFDQDKNSELINSVKKFVEGYDSADYSRASTFALRDEWLKDDDDKQYHIAGGYQALYNHLAKKFLDAGGKIHLNTVVKEIRWNCPRAEVRAGIVYHADKVIVTVPSGVLADKKGKGYIQFSPPVPELDNWIQKSGYGSLIKILIEFTVPFWQDEHHAKENVAQTKDMMFLFSEQEIPTWWTQSPDSFPLLTGWLAGPNANKMKDATDEDIFECALEVLVHLYKIDKDKLKSLVKAWHVKNWTADPFTCGSYSYKTVETDEALKRINKPFGDSLYFAGEALTTGDTGTVEAALESAVRTAGMIIK